MARDPNTRSRERRQRARAKGLCGACCKRPGVDGGFCEPCKERQREAYRREHEGRLRQQKASLEEARLKGLCTKCRRVKPESGKTCQACRDYMKRYRDAHADRIKEQSVAVAERVRLEGIAAYGGKCLCCGEDTPEFLALHHPKGDGKAHRAELKKGTLWYWLRQQGYPEVFELLCHNCHLSRHYYGHCPHESGRSGLRRLWDWHDKRIRDPEEWSRAPKYGSELRGNYRLTAEDVRAIRLAWERDNVAIRKLGRQYGVSATNIRSIVYRRTWKNV